MPTKLVEDSSRVMRSPHFDDENNNGKINTSKSSFLLLLTLIISSSILTFIITRSVMNYHSQSSQPAQYETLGESGVREERSKLDRRVMSTPSSEVFKYFQECSYERILSDGITQTVPITNENLSRIKDVPFGFGCRVVKIPVRIEAIPYGTRYMEERNSDIFSPVKPSGNVYDICQNYSHVSCMDYFCYSNSSLGSVDPYRYEIFNYCKYCKNNMEDFLKFQFKIYFREDSVVNDTITPMDCPAFNSFPSAFYCHSIQAGLPLYYFDIYYRRLRNPFFCYCHEFSVFNAKCDSSLFTSAFDFIKIVVSILFSVLLSLAALVTYVIPQIKQLVKVQKITMSKSFSILLILASSISITVSSILYAVAYLGDYENYTLSNLALSMNVFFTYFSMLPVMLTFDRIYNYLNSGEKRNCPKFKSMIMVTFVILIISFAYVTSTYIVEFTKVESPILLIMASIGYATFAIPWVNNLVLFVFLSYRLRKALRIKTHVSFIKTKYFYQFFALNTLSGLALFSCLSGFIVRQFGRGSTAYQFSYYIEQVSQFSNYSTVMIMLFIIYDAQLFIDCYKPILQLFKLFDSKKRSNDLNDSLLSEDDDKPSATQTYLETMTTSNETRENSSYYIPPTSVTSVESNVSY